ncbi:MAG: ytvI [Clostridia bacterium]|jgi:sporulation integral membrane protein YtvI|nr:ytvI [Clostridia bacterium]
MLTRVELWYDKIGKKLVYTTFILIFVYVFVKYLLGMVAPFIIGWGLASLLNPFVTWLKRSAKVPRGLGALLSMLTILSSLFAVISALLRQLWSQTVAFIEDFPFYKEQIVSSLPMIEEQLDYLQNLIPLPQTFSTLDSLITEVLNSIGKFFQTVIPWAYNVVSGVPNVIIFIVVMLIATFFMTKDYDEIKSFVRAQMPTGLDERMITLKNGLFHALGGYIKTQLIMMSVVFCICLTGLFIIKVPYMLLISVTIAIFDALPVFGSGAILIPWAIYNMIIGQYGIGAGLLSIYAIIFLTRQMLEPRILSGQIGVYALVTVMAMYMGYKILGVPGLIIGPVSAVIIKTLQTTGVLPAFKTAVKK